jgi:hypothetical protein
MRAHHLVPLALAFAAGGCAGGGGSGAPVAPIAAPFVPSTATFPLSVVIPARPSSGTSSARSPRYVSPGTASIAVYDGSTLIYVGNYTPPTQFTTVFAKSGDTSVTSGTCAAGTSSQTCTLTIVTTIGAHTFGVVTYPVPQGQSQSSDRARSDVGTIPAFSGVILAEGELAVTLVAGTNPGQTVTLTGVADRANFLISPALTQRLNGNGPLVGVIGTSYTIQYTITDSSNAQAGGYQIVQPPSVYDNGPVTIAETDGNNIVTMTPISQSSPPPSAGAQTFSVTCQNNGTATITAAAKNRPNATYASGLTYSASNYPNGTIGTTTLQCVPNSATIPVTVQ